MTGLTRVLYTAEATVTGGRQGHARSSDGNLDVELAAPEGMGGEGNKGTNPEQLFAAGYAACFHSALLAIARGHHIDASDSTMVGRVAIGPTGSGGFNLAVTLDLRASQFSPEVAADLLHRAHERCPYSNATRGNIDVTLLFNGEPIESSPSGLLSGAGSKD